MPVFPTLMQKAGKQVIQGGGGKGGGGAAYRSQVLAPAWLPQDCDGHHYSYDKPIRSSAQPEPPAIAQGERRQCQSWDSKPGLPKEGGHTLFLSLVGYDYAAQRGTVPAALWGKPDSRGLTLTQ